MFLLPTALIFVWDLQFSQRTLPKVFPLICALFARGTLARHDGCAASAAPFLLTLLGANQRNKLWVVFFEGTEGPMQKLKQFRAKKKKEKKTVMLSALQLTLKEQMACAVLVWLSWPTSVNPSGLTQVSLPTAQQDTLYLPHMWIS